MKPSTDMVTCHTTAAMALLPSVNRPPPDHLAFSSVLPPSQLRLRLGPSPEIIGGRQRARRDRRPDLDRARADPAAVLAAGRPGKGGPELQARPDPELAIDAREVDLDRLGGDE